MIIRRLRIFILFFVCVSVSFSQGLRLQGNDYLIDERTSYLVFDRLQPRFTSSLSLDFEIAPLKAAGAYDMGYVLRIKNETVQTTYNLLYTNQENTTIFQLNHEGKDILITASFDQQDLLRDSWVKVHLAFDLENDSVLLRLNDSTFKTGGLNLQRQWSPVLYFGRSEHLIEVPDIVLRNLKVTGKEAEYYFPLNESSGERVHDSNKKVVGRVQNPVWLINDAYHWKENVAFHSEKVAGSGFNTETCEAYYFNADSISFYNIKSKERFSRRYHNRCPLNFRQGSNFIDTKQGRLYVYDVTSLREGEVSVAYLDLTDFSWSAVSTSVLPVQLYHHTGFSDWKNNRYIIFGGFGFTRYSNDFYAYDLKENQWSMLNFEGDKITPRYFSSIGYQAEENALYLFGGMGNESGNQTVGRVYYYDLYKIDLNNNVVTKLWEIPWNNENVVPVRSLLMMDDNAFYTLCYPEHVSNSWLKLYRFSLEDGRYEVVGDSISIISEKINTHANLYYHRSSGRVYSVVQEFDNDDIASTATFYSLLFPPVTQEDLTYYDTEETFSLFGALSYVVLLLVIALCGFFIWKLNKKAKKKKPVVPLSERKPVVQQSLKKEENHLVPETRANAIYLFGGLSVYDRNKYDITHLLSTKLKQAFLLILEHSLDNGISMQEFSELLWPDKSEDKVKNSRGVTINNLRKIFGELDGVKLIHEKGYYKIVFTSECYCDYIHFRTLILQQHIESFSAELLQIISFGKFLKSVDSPLLDDFKASVERLLEPVLQLEMEKSYIAGNYMQAISFAGGLFNIDSFHEEAFYYRLNALVKLKRVDEARKKYLLFVTGYKKAMGEDYPKEFTDIVS